jgi:hypothetical protein
MRPSVMRASAWIVLVALLLAGAPAEARTSGTLKLRFPRFAIPPGASVEACFVVRLPGTAPFDLVGWETRQHAPADVLPVHFLVYQYTGERLGELAAAAGRVIPSRGCLDFGPVDRDRRQLIVSSQSARSQNFLPTGVALRLEPASATPGGAPEGVALILDGNWSNGSTRTRFVSAEAILRRAKRGTVRRFAQQLYETAAEQGLSVAPGQLVSTEDTTTALNGGVDAWHPAADACVVTLAGHMHRRGRFIGVDLLDANGAIANPPDGVANPYVAKREHFFGVFDYTDTGLLVLANPQLVRAGEGLHYACWTENGTRRPLRLGCEEVVSVPPGQPLGAPGGGPAKPCAEAGPESADCPATDPTFPGRSFTGSCATANVNAGAPTDDEACALTGAYFDASNGGCDVSTLPPVN